MNYRNETRNAAGETAGRLASSRDFLPGALHDCVGGEPTMDASAGFGLSALENQINLCRNILADHEGALAELASVLHMNVQMPDPRQQGRSGDDPEPTQLTALLSYAENLTQHVMALTAAVRHITSRVR